MRPTDPLEDNVRRISFRASPELSRDIWDNVLEERSRKENAASAAGRLHIWEILMRSRVVQLSIVSILAVAAIAWGVSKIASTWSSKPQSYRGQIRVGTPLDLDSPVILPLDNKQQADFDIAWSEEEGGTLVVPPGSPARILAIKRVRDQEGALEMAWDSLNELRESTSTRLPAQQSRFVAVLTNRSNLAIVEIAWPDPQGAWLYWRLEMAYPPTFSSVKTATLYLTDHSTPQAVCAIDLDTGRSLQIPSQVLQAGGQTLLGWLEQNGVDAVAIMQSEELGLSGIGLVCEPWPPSAWSGTEPLALYTNLTNSSQQLAEPMTFKAQQYQPVYAFKTREGGFGELQILSVDKVGRSVTFRYRTLQPTTAGPVYSYAEADPESDQLASSVKRLRYVGLFVQMYAGDHNGRWPDTLPDLKAYVEVENEQDFQWIVDNVEYLGKGMTTAGPATQVMAYDRTLMKEGKGTHVVYLDGSVAFRSPAELEELGTAAEP